MQQIEPEDRTFTIDSQPLRSRGRIGITLAWIVIFCMSVGMIGLHFVDAEVVQGEGGADDLGISLMRVQGMYMVGAGEILPGQRQQLYGPSATSLNLGTPAQRMRFIVLAADMAGPGEAARLLGELRSLLADPLVGEPPELAPSEHDVLAILGKLYPHDSELDEGESRAAQLAESIERLTPEEIATLEEGLGWFGSLALVPAGIDGVTRRSDVVGPAKTLTIGIFIIAGLAIGGLMIGFIGLVVMLVLLIGGRLRTGVQASASPHGVYAETFAIWMVLFVGLQGAAAVLAMTVPGLSGGMMMAINLVAFFASLGAVAWPAVRGVPFQQVRQDIGWTLGRQPLLEPVLGVGGYLMALPILAIGIVMTFLLMVIQGFLMSGEVDTFAPAGGPAHPIVLELASQSWLAIVMIYLLASVAAPIVEETFFRGVLYRHLREASRGLGLFMSIAFSTLLSSFIFAAIHPQGVVAIPALMSLAIAFALMREWRGSVLPSMIMHGVSNGLVMTMALWLFTAG